MWCHGGAKRDRTADLLNAIQALSQLSYTPSTFGQGSDTMVVVMLSRVFRFLVRRNFSIQLPVLTPAGKINDLIVELNVQ